MAEIDAYNEALKSGQYQKPTGLLGKYDNVRRFWEDGELGFYLKPSLERLLARRKERGEGLRVLDLGCGSGDGFELVCKTCNNGNLGSKSGTNARRSDTSLFYKGIDINEGLLRQAQAVYDDKQNMVFVQADFNRLDFRAEDSFDLYLANYGTLSHNADEQTVELLSNLATHSRDGAIIMVDWLGRYSYEWQTLWAEDVKHNQWMDYAISYIYSDSGTLRNELTYFPLRIMGRKEALQIHRQVRKKAGGNITLRKLADRSSFVGRHMDTAQYNPHCRPLRGVVNRLFEPDLSTDLDEALIHYIPRDGFAEANTYHRRLADCWNYLITYTKALLDNTELPAPLPTMPLPLRKSLSIMKGVMRVAVRIGMDRSRSSLVEPQLGYCLRGLEMELQRGRGFGHGLVAIFEVVK